jgi:hypothetical protein
MYHAFKPLWDNPNIVDIARSRKWGKMDGIITATAGFIE